MVDTTILTQDPYEDVLKQLLAEITELRQKVEFNAKIQRLQKDHDHYQSGTFSKSACNLAHYLALLAEITELRQKVEFNANQRLQKYHDHYQSGTFSKSACNLAHYLAMRQFDLRDLQDRLAQAGLSSLGRAEALVLSTLDSLIDVLKRATDKQYLPGKKIPGEYCFNQGQQLLEQHTIELFGPFHELNEYGRAHVMVTLGSGSFMGLPAGKFIN